MPMPPKKKAEGHEKLRERIRLWSACAVILLMSLLIFYPLMFIGWLKRTLTQREPPSRTASAVALGLMMSVMPIWGFQMLATVGLAHGLKLNKVVAAAFSNASLPPLIPLIIYTSIKLGGFVTGTSASVSFTDATMESIGDSVATYAIGAVLLGIIMGLLTWPLAYGVIAGIKKGREKRQ